MTRARARPAGSFRARVHGDARRPPRACAPRTPRRPSSAPRPGPRRGRRRRRARAPPPGTRGPLGARLLQRGLAQRCGYVVGRGAAVYDDAHGARRDGVPQGHGMARRSAPTRGSCTAARRAGRLQACATREHGRHVEADLSRQVLALIDDGRVAADLPHVLGRARRRRRCSARFHVYRKTPGTNAKGMVALELLHPRLRDPRLRRRARVQREPRLLAGADPRRARRSTTWAATDRPKASTSYPLRRALAASIGDGPPAETLHRGAARARAGHRRGHADQRRDRPVLRRRQARDPAARRASPRSASWSPRTPREWGATAVGGLTMGADAPACAALAGGADVQGLLRAQGDQGPRPAAPRRGPAARAGRRAA